MLRIFFIKFSKDGHIFLEIIIFQWSDMLSDYARIYVGHFSFKSVNKFFYNIIKTSPKFSHFVVRSCVDCTRGGCEGAITLTQQTANTDNFTFMKQSFCDTGTLRKQKLTLPIPTRLPDIYIKM